MPQAETVKGFSFLNIIMKTLLIILTALLFFSCSKQEPETRQANFKGIFAPMPCENLNPSYVIITIDGIEHYLDVIYQSGAVIATTTITLELKKVRVSNIRVFNGNDEVVMFTKPWEKSGRVVIPDDYEVTINDRSNITAQLFCTKN